MLISYISRLFSGDAGRWLLSVLLAGVGGLVAVAVGAARDRYLERRSAHARRS